MGLIKKSKEFSFIVFILSSSTVEECVKKKI